MELTGIFPISKVISLDKIQEMVDKGIKPLSEYDPDLMFVWFISRKIELKKTKAGKQYAIVSVLDSTSSETKIKCWNYKDGDIMMNKAFIARIDHDDQWGFSSKSAKKCFRMV